MPFGISSAPEEYQRRQHEMLECIVDDILVYGCGETLKQAIEDHDKNLISLLNRARESNLKLTKDKLRLRLTEVRCIGHVLTAQGLRPDPEKVKAVQEMPRPENVHAVQRFLGFVN